MKASPDRLMFKVYRKGYHPKPRKHFYPGEFISRQVARRFCRNRSYEDELTIVHPNGKEEQYDS